MGRVNKKVHGQAMAPIGGYMPKMSSHLESIVYASHCKIIFYELSFYEIILVATQTLLSMLVIASIASSFGFYPWSTSVFYCNTINITIDLYTCSKIEL